MQVELGPGLLGQVFDGVQRPLSLLSAGGEESVAEPFLRRGTAVPSLDRERRWDVEHTVAVGDEVGPGDVLATVEETRAVRHLVLVPPGVSGTVSRLGGSPLTVTDPVVWIDGEPVPMLQRWPVRQRRPELRRLDPHVPLVTGQRVVDTLFPVARGGSATIPGGFGTGKTVHEQTLAKWSDVDVVVYVGCGERGNELAEVLEGFPKLVDPRTGASLMERTILIANTSNMPVAAREASIYTAIDDRRVLPRPGTRRGGHGRLDDPVGRGAAGGVEPARGDARRGGLPGVPRRPARRVLRAGGSRRDPRRGGGGR